MNWKRGLKRITLLISIIVAVGMGVMVADVISHELHLENKRDST